MTSSLSIFPIILMKIIMSKVISELLNEDSIKKTLLRLSHEIVEKKTDLSKLAIIGIRTRGDIIAKRIKDNIKSLYDNDIDLGTLDVTFFRDDFSSNFGSPKVGPSIIPFSLESKNIILVDDVLYTGRTIRAAMDEIFSFGRPKSISLCVLSNRGHRELPIRPDFVGKNFPTSKSEYIYVHVKEVDNEDAILLVEYEDEKSE